MIFQKLNEIFFIILGSLIYALGLNYFIIANHFEGGFTGISLSSIINWDYRLER